ncbi:MAG: hypothetical protein GY822_14450 [Deltaproteobacteria bacterium]|nr:hypothetical protein [Deltaproteobacteria bacterium]
MANSTQMHSEIGQTLAKSIKALREKLGSPFTPITVLVPALPNAGLTRRALAAHGPFIRVWFSTPEELVRAAVPPAFIADALPGESPQWMHTALGDIVKRLKEKEGFAALSETLSTPGWRKPLLNALRKLEHQGVNAALLQKVSVDVETERLTLLRELLSQVEQARFQDKIATPNSLAEAALASTARGSGVGQATADGVILVGDSTLSHATFQFLKAWLSEREVLQLVLPAEEHLPFAEEGMLAAAPNVETCFVKSTSPGALATLQARLGSPQKSEAKTLDDHVEFVLTPDERREKAEAVREIQQALSDGTPLDRIAVVVPNRGHLDALESSLHSAGIPVTWHVGQPLSELPPARFLRLSLALAQGDTSVEQCYHFLTHPSIKLSQALGPKGDDGKARWRRILSKCGYALGLSRIAGAVQKQRDDIAEEQKNLDATATPEDKLRLERKQIGASTLHAALLEMNDFAVALNAQVPLAEHAQHWAAHLDKWTRNSQEQNQIKSSLNALQLSKTQFSLSVSEAAEELDAHLSQESPRGRITDAAVKVLSPMQLLGGEFDLVCLLGMTEGSFPAAISEDPLLSDSLIAALNDDKHVQEAGLKLRPSKEVAGQERRRLAAVVGGACKRLWVSIPQQLFDPERPLLPSAFVLDMLSCFLGRPARFTDLEHYVSRRGTRAQPICRTPERALGAAEYLAARLLLTSTSTEDAVSKAALSEAARILSEDARSSAISALASHPFGRGLLAMHQSLNLVTKGEAEINAWTGKVSPDVMPCLGLDGEALSLWQMKALLRNPGGFFFRYMLKAYKAPSLTPQHPLNHYALRDEVKEAIATHLEGTGVTSASFNSAGIAEKAFVEAATQQMLDALAFAPATNESEVAAAVQEINESIEEFLKKHADLLGSTSHEFEDLPLDDGLPFHVKGDGYFEAASEHGATALNAFATFGKTTKLLARDEPELVLAAMALSHQLNIDNVTSLNPDEKWSTRTALFTAQQDEMLAELKQAHADANAGSFAVGEDNFFGLAADKAIADVIKEQKKKEQQAATQASANGKEST